MEENITAQNILRTRESIDVKTILDRFEIERHAVEVAFVGVHLNDETRLKLFNMGFKYRQAQDVIGLTVHIISVV